MIRNLPTTARRFKAAIMSDIVGYMHVHGSWAATVCPTNSILNTVPGIGNIAAVLYSIQQGP